MLFSLALLTQLELRIRALSVAPLRSCVKRQRQQFSLNLALSNPQEAARLNSSAYQETLANAIVAGIKSYYEKAAKV